MSSVTVAKLSKETVSPDDVTLISSALSRAVVRDYTFITKGLRYKLRIWCGAVMMTGLSLLS